MKKINHRKMMELAIEVMRTSVAEDRPDGKATPKVGAAIVKPDGKVETACRGELRYGDHAEYTLLERKNRDSKLDGSILYATLEPCAPGSRSHPKLPCAERIVLARIKEVWVGIGDPDPNIDGRGIAYLRSKGVTVHMFDRDLQELIQAENKEFIAQAVDRAAAVREEKPREIETPTLEQKLSAAGLGDFSAEALTAYREAAKVAAAVTSEAFNQRLADLNLLQKDNGQWGPTGFGLLLFGKQPRLLIPQAGLLGTIRYGAGADELKDFDGPQVLVPDLALRWLRDKLPNPVVRNEARRQEVNDPLFQLAREGIVNALVHRDYRIEGAKSQLLVTPEVIEIRSPGKPVEPITLEQLQSFTAPMLSRNPRLHYIFAQMELAEERGLGLKSMKEAASKAGLPRPRYTWEDPYLVLTLYRTQEAALAALPKSVLQQMSSSEGKGWRWLAEHGRAKSTEYAKAMDIDERAARLHLTKFVRLGLVRKVGSARSTAYEVV